MPDRRDLPLDLTLDRFWDEVFPGEPAGSDLEPLDPGLAATVRRVHALETAPPADPVFASRLWEVLMHAQGIAGSISLRPTPPPAGPTARAHPAPRPRPLFGAPDSRRRWALAQAALAATVVIALVGLYLAYRGPEQPAVVNPTPVPATPIGTPTPAFADVPNYRATAGRTGVNPGPGPTGQPVEIWRADLGADLKSSPATTAGVLYAGGGDGKLHALDAATGTERWTFSTGGPIATSPTVAGGLVFIGSSDGDLYAVDAATGTQRWSLPGAGDNVGTVAVDGNLYVGADAGVLALDVATGTERWRYAAGGAVSARMPAFADGVVYDGTSDGNLNALNATDGSIVWQFKTDGGRFTTPTVADGIVFQGNPDAPVQRLYALDAKTGGERWRFAAGVQAYAAAVGGGLAYVNAGDGAVYALDAATGQLRWRFATGAPNLGNGPALVGDTLYVAGEDGNLYALDASSGELRWQVTVGESATAPVIIGGMVYFETVNGSLVALGDASAAPGGTTAVAGGEGATPAAPTTAATPNAATLIWTTQGGADGLVNPGDLAIDPQGRLWVADNAHSRFQLFSADGTFLQTFGEGTFRFGINGASSGEVAFAPDGTTYVVDATARTVSKFDPNGRLVATWGGTSSVPVHLSQPENLVVDAAGTVWVGGDGLHAIFHLDPDGQVLGTITDSPDLRLEAIGGMAIDGAGDLYLVNGASHIVELRPDGTLLRTLSDFNDPDGTFNGTPIFMTVDKSGNLFVTAVDWSANPLRGRIEVFAPDGTVVVASDWAGQFPTGIALDGAGNVYIADYNENTVQKFRLLPPLASAPTDATVAPTSAATTASPAATTGPAAALVRQAPAESVDGWLASDGKLWVADGDRNHYRILSPADGHEVEVWQATMPDGVAYGLLAFGPQGEIYIYDIATHRVAKFDRDRHFVFVWGGTGTGDGQFVGDVYGLVVDRAGNVSVADGGRNLVQKFDADGHFLLKWGGTGPGNGQFADMGWPTVDAAGNVYVPDIGNNRVEKFDPDGTFLSAFGSFGPGDGELNAPNDVAVDAAGNVYVADWKNSRVEVFDAAGRYAAQWGGFGHAEGQFTHVDGVELDNQGNIYVADPDARHIDKFHLLPPLAPAT